MKPEDLVVGERYFDIKKEHLVLIYRQSIGISSGTSYCFDFEMNTNGGATGHTFHHKEVEDLIFKYIEEKPTPHPNIYTGEKTMPVRKPEQIRIELTNEELTNFLSSLGYDLSDYELEDQVSKYHGFIFGFRLKEADEKTKTTD